MIDDRLCSFIVINNSDITSAEKRNIVCTLNTVSNDVTVVMFITDIKYNLSITQTCQLHSLSADGNLVLLFICNTHSLLFTNSTFHSSQKIKRRKAWVWMQMDCLSSQWFGNNDVVIVHRKHNFLFLRNLGPRETDGQTGEPAHRDSYAAALKQVKHNSLLHSQFSYE